LYDTKALTLALRCSECRSVANANRGGRTVSEPDGYQWWAVRRHTAFGPHDDGERETTTPSAEASISQVAVRRGTFTQINARFSACAGRHLTDSASVIG